MNQMTSARPRHSGEEPAVAPNTAEPGSASSRESDPSVRDKPTMNQMNPGRPRRSEDGLGANTDIGAKLRALYGSVQDEGIPDKLLDLLEKLDQAERGGASSSSDRENNR
jgi:hypothetical protein